MALDRSRARVWIVDDSALEVEVARSLLARVFDAEVFREPTAMLERWARGERPDVLVLDWHMPDMTGLDVCTLLRTQVNSAELPILMITAIASRDDLLLALAAGANDFLLKPYAPAELVARVSTLAETSRLHRRVLHAEAGLRDEAAFRERFMAILAHDLRQPLSVFSMGAALLRETPTDSPLGMVARRFGNASSRMQRMLDDLLDFSQTRHHGGMPIERRPTDLGEVAERVVAEVRLSRPGREVMLASRGDVRGDWDGDRLAQVVSNLVGNACDHGDDTSPVRVVIDGDSGNVTLAVENASKVIPADVLQTLFDPFKKGPASRKGLGLGLYIVKAIARAHGGDVVAHSEAGRTRLAVTLPRTPAAPPPRQDELAS